MPDDFASGLSRLHKCPFQSGLLGAADIGIDVISHHQSLLRGNGQLFQGQFKEASAKQFNLFTVSQVDINDLLIRVGNLI